MKSMTKVKVFSNCEASSNFLGLVTKLKDQISYCLYVRTFLFSKRFVYNISDVDSQKKFGILLLLFKATHEERVYI